MIGFPSRRARRDLPVGQDRSASFLPWVVALMVYVAALAGTGLVVLGDTFDAAERSLAETETLQVPADVSQARLETILALLRQTRGVVSVHLLEPAETARLLRPWLGASVALDHLPVPRLIDLRVDPYGATDFTVLRQHLASVAPQAKLDDHRSWLAEVGAAAHRVERMLAALIAAVLLLIALSAMFAARVFVAAHRPALELLVLLGAADRDIVRPLAMRSLRWGLLAAGVGSVAAVVTIVALSEAGVFIALAAPIKGAGLSDWRLWVVPAAIVPVTGLLAMASARVTMLRRLAEMP